MIDLSVRHRRMGAGIARVARVVACAGANCPASEFSYFFTISNEVSPEQPATTITLWAAFPPELYAFAQSYTNVSTSPDAGNLSDPTLLMYRHGGSAGDVSADGDRVSLVHPLQLDCCGDFADTSNPIAVWSVVWTTDDFTPRQVPIDTDAWTYWVYLDIGGGAKNFYDKDFGQGHAIIDVVGDGCYPEFTGDDVLDLFDFLVYVNSFNAGEDAADCDASGALDLFDFLCFTDAFNEGC